MLFKTPTREGNGNPLQYSCLENPMDRGAWWAAVHGVARRQTRLSDFIALFTFMHWRRKWQPTPVFLLGESQGRGSLVGYRLWGRTESDTTEATQQQQQQQQCTIGPCWLPILCFSSVQFSSVAQSCPIQVITVVKYFFNSIPLPAAAAKSLQLCPTLCNPIDGSPPGSPIPGILQARTLEWVAISFSNA